MRINSKRRPWQPEPKPFERRKHKNTALYNSRKWRALRESVLQREPLCRICAKDGEIKPAQMVDHIKPVNKGGSFTDIDNLQPLCNTCHAKKSATES